MYCFFGIARLLVASPHTPTQAARLPPGGALLKSCLTRH